MKLIVISSPVPVPNEHQIINSLLEEGLLAGQAGLEIFHVHKPNFSQEEIQNYLQHFPLRHHRKIFLHSDFPKFHSLEELKIHNKQFEYAFLSPIFNSISKKGYKSKFNLQELKNSSFFRREAKEKAIIALGGIDENNIAICRELGFAGVAVCGALWQHNNPVEKFLRIKAKCQKKDLVF